MADNKNSLRHELTKGIIKENPVLVMLLGMCPTLAVTTQAKNGIGMGLATTFVLLGSNIVISLLRKVIPDKVRIPAFIVIIASFVTLIGFILEGFMPELYDSLGIYLTVDNVLQRIADPLFIGAVIESGMQSGSKVVSKADPDERVGVLCLEDGMPSIVEYYEMTDEMRTLRDENGDLSYRFGVILNYLFNVEKLLEISGKKLPVHIVDKKIPYMNENGEMISSDNRCRVCSPL